ncbi:MAG: exo-alpha-sialidase [Planctomycetes bacterium]|nr:exo-alpha-sialidase [Planctomycetota bacterium]
MGLTWLLMGIVAGLGQEPPLGRWPAPEVVHKEAQGKETDLRPMKLWRGLSGELSVLWAQRNGSFTSVRGRDGWGAPALVGSTVWMDNVVTNGREYILKREAPGELRFEVKRPEAPEPEISVAIPEKDREGAALRAKYPEVSYEFSALAVDGKSVYLVQTTEHPVHVLFNSSADGGKTWRGFSFVGENLWRNDSYQPAIFLVDRKIHVLFGTRDGRIRQAVSADEGKTWSDISMDLDFQVGGFKAVASERAIRLCFLGIGASSESLGYWYCESVDHGKSWSEPVLIGKTREGDLAIFFEFMVGESWIVAGYTLMGRSDNYPKEAKVMASGDEGKTWKDLKLAEGLEGGTGRPKIIMDGAKIDVAFVQVPEEGRAGEIKLLFREYAP